MNNENDGILTKAQIQPLLPAYFKKLHSTLTSILNDHVGEEKKKEEEELEKNKVYMIIKIMQTIQSTLVTQESKRKHDMGTMIGSVKQEIKQIMGNNIPD
jgi:argonaute-like protein implicated in RNA metabolism and viral defense